MTTKPTAVAAKRPPLAGNGAKTSAQRQAAYRSRRPTAGPDHNGERRLTVWVSTGAAMALARLARRYQVTQRTMVEHLLTAADDDVLRTLAADTAELDTYLSLAPLPGNDHRATTTTAPDPPTIPRRPLTPHLSDNHHPPQPAKCRRTGHHDCRQPPQEDTHDHVDH